MHKENAISWKSVAKQYNQWAIEAGVAPIVAGRSFGEISLDLLSHTFGRHSLFLDEQVGLVGLYLGNFSITFEFIAERRACTKPSVISLPERLSKAPSGLCDLYLAIGENFVGHNLGGRLCTISPHPDEAEELVFILEEEADRPLAADQRAEAADTSMFRQIWQILLRASEQTGRRASKADPDGGAGKADADRTATAVGSKRRRGRSGQSKPSARPQLTEFLGRKASPLLRSEAWSTDLNGCF
ncbi:MAG: hypothetical protein OEU92_04945 [Alphaproteobacteria bacterium]|nr:hypothetical protein [Alphaproteobacteria bacterium]